MTYPSRQQYMAGDVTHEQYYTAVAKTAGIAVHPGNPMVERARKALAKGDEHLNTIPLREWDSWAYSLLPGVARAFKEHGDTDTLAGRVSLLKTVVKKAADMRKNPAKRSGFQRFESDPALKARAKEIMRARREARKHLYPTPASESSPIPRPYHGARMKTNPHKRTSKKPLSAAQKRARELFVQRVRSGAFKRTTRAKLKANKPYYETKKGRVYQKNPRRKFSRRKARVAFKKVYPGWNRAAGVSVRKRRVRKNPVRSRRRIVKGPHMLAVKIRPGKIEFITGLSASGYQTGGVRQAKRFSTHEAARTYGESVQWKTGKRVCIVTGKTTVAELNKVFGQ